MEILCEQQETLIRHWERHHELRSSNSSSGKQGLWQHTSPCSGQDNKLERVSQEDEKAHNNTEGHEDEQLQKRTNQEKKDVQEEKVSMERKEEEDKASGSKEEKRAA